MRSYFFNLQEICSFSIKKIVLVFFLFLVFPVAASAASLSFSPAAGTYQEGASLTVGVFVGSGGTALNAVSGVVSFPNDILEITSISKNQSIISLWVQEPSFSNSAGTVNFEGIVLNPGYSGSNGRVLNITFRVKAAGEANLAFSAGSILANDGEGSEILSGKGTAKYQLTKATLAEPEEDSVAAEAPIANSALAPSIASASHSLNGWSNQTTGVFNFDLTEDITSIRLLLDDDPTSIPLVVYTPPITSREIKDLDEGVSYLHVQYKNAEGWGEILHYKIQIDTVAPDSFVIKEVATSTFLFEASDAEAGILDFEVQIDGGEVVKFIDDGSHIYRAPELPSGEHTLFVKAFDAAGNFATATASFVAFTPTPTPVAEVKSEVPAVNNMLVQNGTILITILSIIIPSLALILLLIALLFLAWRSVGGLRKRIDKEVLEARVIIHNAFTLLKTDLEEDIETLKKANTKRKLTREEAKILKRLQKNLDEAEKVINKEVSDIEKELN